MDGVRNVIQPGVRRDNHWNEVKKAVMVSIVVGGCAAVIINPEIDKKTKTGGVFVACALTALIFDRKILAAAVTYAGAVFCVLCLITSDFSSSDTRPTKNNFYGTSESNVLFYTLKQNIKSTARIESYPYNTGANIALENGLYHTFPGSFSGEVFISEKGSVYWLSGSFTETNGDRYDGKWKPVSRHMHEGQIINMLEDGTITRIEGKDRRIFFVNKGMLTSTVKQTQGNDGKWPDTH